MLTLVGILSMVKSHWREAVIAGLFMLACALDLDANHWHKLADQRAATIAQVQVAQKAAQVAAQAAHDAQEQRYKEHADAQQAIQQARVKPASDATDSFADGHRVQQCPASRPASPAIASSPRVDPGVPASVPASTDVVISNDDLHRCTDAYVYALGAHDWAVRLSEPRAYNAPIEGW